MKQSFAPFFSARDAFQNQDNCAPRRTDVDRFIGRIENKNPVGHKHTFRLRQIWMMAELKRNESEPGRSNPCPEIESRPAGKLLDAQKCVARKLLRRMKESD
jgi:hypothetical protein